jgi:hypothetical protein
MYVEMEELDGSWDKNERKVSCYKYSKIRMVVDTDDGFRE